MTIIHLKNLTPADIEDQAACAADNAQPLEDSNLFEPGTTQHNAFNVAYRSRLAWLGGVPA